MDEPVSAAISANLFAWGAVAPLLGYGLAAGAHLVARAFGGRGGFLGARAALFWSGLAVTPAALAIGASRRRGGRADRAGAGLARLARLRRTRALGLDLRGEPRRGRGVRLDRRGWRRASSSCSGRSLRSSSSRCAAGSLRRHVAAARHRQPGPAARGGAAGPRGAAPAGEPRRGAVLVSCAGTLVMLPRGGTDPGAGARRVRRPDRQPAARDRAQHRSSPSWRWPRPGSGGSSAGRGRCRGRSALVVWYNSSR